MLYYTIFICWWPGGEGGQRGPRPAALRAGVPGPGQVRHADQPEPWLGFLYQTWYSMVWYGIVWYSIV